MLVIDGLDVIRDYKMESVDQVDWNDVIGDMADSIEKQHEKITLWRERDRTVLKNWLGWYPSAYRRQFIYHLGTHPVHYHPRQTNCLVCVVWRTSGQSRHDDEVIRIVNQEYEWNLNHRACYRGSPMVGAFTSIPWALQLELPVHYCALHQSGSSCATWCAVAGFGIPRCRTY